MGEDFPAGLAWFGPGSVVAGYRLETVIGTGGMAVVFRARDERLGRLVALKILTPVLAADGAFRRRFIAESRAAAAVDDPHIIPVYEAGEADGVLFIAMRLVRGGDLRRVLEQEAALPPGRVAELISPVASALDAAHRAGLVHRDVKPANILVDASADRPDHVYLSDFGVSKGTAESVSLTGTGQFLGTPAYSAPEQIRGRMVTGRTDQYALACVAYQLLTGSAPFERDQGMAVLLAHLSEPPPSLRSRRPDLPAAVDQVLARALAKAPEQRYASCVEFAEALRRALGPTDAPAAVTVDWPPGRGSPGRGSPGRGSPGRAGSRARSRTRSPGSSRARRRALMAAAAAVVAVIIALVTVGLPGPGTPPAVKPTPRATPSVKPTPRTTTAVVPPSHNAAFGRVPPYYVWITADGNPNYNPPYATVRLTATGATLASIKPSAPNGTITAVAAVGDDRTFVLDEQPWVTQNNPNADQGFAPRTFYLVRLGASGRPGPPIRLPVTEPSGALVTGFALSPDHTELAVAVQPDNVPSDPNLQQVKLYSLATGAVLRTWHGDGTIGSSADDAESLSWTSDQRTLAFAWEGAPQQGEWLLDLSRGGTDLLGDSREAVGTSCEPDLIITLDGSAVVCGATDYSAADGKVIRTVAEESPADVLWSNPSGSVLIVWAGDAVGMVTAGKFTPLPGLSSWREDQGAW